MALSTEMSNHPSCRELTSGTQSCHMAQRSPSKAYRPLDSSTVRFTMVVAIAMIAGWIDSRRENGNVIPCVMGIFGDANGKSVWITLYFTILFLVLNGLPPRFLEWRKRRPPTLSKSPKMSVSMDQINSLRRNVSKNSLQAAKRISKAARVSSAAGLSQLSEAVKNLSTTRWKGSVTAAPCPQRHTAVLSTKEPFVARNLISQMTLNDVTTVVRYAMDSNRTDFDETALHLSPLMEEVKFAMDTATFLSRGSHVVPAAAAAQQEAPYSTSNMDAFQFCAAMRIFAEWRIVRQVPEGYKGYEFGMQLGRKDLIQNLSKIELAAHSWIDQKLKSSNEDHLLLSSPTLRQLLEHEVEHHVHSKLPKLNDNTAAIGLLWTKRQVHYQTSVFANLLEVPHVYRDSAAAVGAAYKEVFDAYHGWVIQTIFQRSFHSAPQPEDVYKFMNPHYLKKVMEASQNNVVEQGTNMRETTVDRIPLLCQSSISSNESDGSSFEDSRTVENENVYLQDDEDNEESGCTFGIHFVREWEKARNHIQSEWEKYVLSSTARLDVKRQKTSTKQFEAGEPPLKQVADECGDIQPETLEQMQMDMIVQKEAPQLSVVPSMAMEEGEDIETFIKREMTKDAHNHMSSFLEVVQPLLKDLQSLLDEFGMNDPSRV